MAVSASGLPALADPRLGDLQRTAQALGDAIMPMYVDVAVGEGDSNEGESRWTEAVVAALSAGLRPRQCSQLSSFSAAAMPALSDLRASDNAAPAIKTAPDVKRRAEPPRAPPSGANAPPEPSCGTAAASAATSALWFPTPHGVDERGVRWQLVENNPVPLSFLRAVLFS